MPPLECPFSPISTCFVVFEQELSEPDDVDGADDDEYFGEDMFGDDDLDLHTRYLGSYMHTMYMYMYRTCNMHVQVHVHGSVYGK